MRSDAGVVFGAVKKSAISEDIVANLLSLIRERELRPGDKLPPERELAAMMQVSRPSLREALRALSIMNVIEIRQGDGTYVTSLEPNLLMSHLDFVFALTDATFLELFEARKILEPGIVAMAAARITDEEIAQLEACLARSMEKTHEPEAFVAADLELHETIARAAKNSILERFMASISQLGRVSRTRTVQLPGVIQRSVQDHQAIVQALKARDPEAARQAMLQHLLNVERELRELGASRDDHDDDTAR
ncbi:FadR family transcriptional regulator [Litorilinea aerophila]|uniref:FadR family transcriptional regulator n=1 Tax=Litorilinea aerophila TaxID=1204385 RepID=A0A540VIA6_9CHLR|nr:FadR/GntR family transcriptional regulator [Litorilinea aerophila]MCC9075744.1 FadR family transcriptional regulator [Litorilinea aerophila]GIV77331.1 MAG: GntR family transcriptional regulator [Litorilinea sp.]